ncbi:VOC family protein [Paraburkholderia sp. RL17-347-BIC-D]|uniref:VOC family protein n=1 Tax=Paraburkholderia sp. RL17-347-BIC-D TaxID=3031632 RepID=UPI0038B88A7E
MGLHHVDHYAIETNDLDATKRFYCDLLGLSEGHRPTLPFPGAWLYCENGKPTVHVMLLVEGQAPARSGYFHHVSFSSSGAEEIRGRLEAAGIAFKTVVLPGFGNTQFFMKDPNGVSVELIFPVEETRQSDIDAQNSGRKESFFLKDQ